MAGEIDINTVAKAYARWAPVYDFVFQWFDGIAWQDVPETRTRQNEHVDWQGRFRPVTSNRFRLLFFLGFAFPIGQALLHQKPLRLHQ